MRLGCLNPVVAICVTFLVSGPARAQPLFGHAESIDCAVLNADAVVVGRIVDSSDIKRVKERQEQAATIAVEEMLKGEHQQRLRIRLAHPNSFLAQWKNDPRRLLLVAVQGDPPTETTTIDLSDEDLNVLTADLTVLRKPEVVIRNAKEAARRMPGVRRIDTFRLQVPREPVAGTKWERYYMTGGYITVQVPVDERLEKRAHDYIGSKSYSQRIEGAQALRYFKSDENSARIKSLLDDPVWAYSEHAEDNFGIEVRFYGVRQAAYETLQYWGVAADKPLLREEVEKLDSVQAVNFTSSEVTAEDLKKLNRFKNLKDVNLSDTRATDAHLKELSAFTRLESLNLANTQVTDAGLKHLSGLKRLRFLTLDVTKVTDAGLKELAVLHSLEHLYLEYTHVTDAGLKELASLKSLAVLDLSNTKVTDDGLAELAALKSLQELYVRRAPVTAAGIARLQKLLPNLKIYH